MICKKATSKLPRAWCKDDLTRFCQTTHSPRIARGVANDLAARLGDNNTRRDPDANREIRQNFRAAHILGKSEAGVYCPLCRVFLGDRVTEVGKYFAPNALPYDPAELGDDGTSSSAVCIDNRLQFLGVCSQLLPTGANSAESAVICLRSAEAGMLSAGLSFRSRKGPFIGPALQTPTWVANL